MKSRRLIALLTDFGDRDGFVGAMRGVIAEIAPGTQVIDIAHDVPPQSPLDGAFVLWSVYQFFPAGTIFVAVVDPGVGTERRILCVQTSRHLFLAPENGLLDLVLSQEKIVRAVQVTNRRYFLKNVSDTFHGRDIFAPVAAHLSNGISLDVLGERIALVQPSGGFLNVPERGEATGRVLHIDRFGNIVTNLRFSQGDRKRNVDITIKRRHVCGLYKTYAEIASGRLGALVGSHGLIEIALRDGRASDVIHVSAGALVKIRIEA
jgi:hypothetical protein